MSKDKNPRAVALALFEGVMQRQLTLDHQLQGSRDLAALSDRDRAFARRLAATLLRRLGQVDGAIDHCLAKPLPAKQAGVRNLLRLGAVQLLFLETPAHAAVSTTLALARHPRLAGQKGLINAILRRLAREGAALVADQDGARLNTPDWLWRAWETAYGGDTARRIATAQLAEAPLDVTAKTGPEDWAARLDGSVMPNGTIRLREARGDVAQLPGFAEGAWWVQDMAAAMVAQIMGAQQGERIVDLCAAPGGKTALMAAQGADVTAIDKVPARLARLRENMARLNLTVRTEAVAGESWRPQEAVDGVLLDAPCSATGTIRRHPDVLHLKQAEGLAALRDSQARLLRAGVEMLRPGGRLVYAVCSLQPEEGPDQVAGLLASDLPVARQPLTPAEVFGLAELLTPEGDFRSLPCHLAERGGMDGFYACRLLRL